MHIKEKYSQNGQSHVYCLIFIQSIIYLLLFTCYCFIVFGLRMPWNCCMWMISVFLKIREIFTLFGNHITYHVFPP